MHKLGYGLIFWASITYCIGQPDTTGYAFELKAGLSGQFFLHKAKKSVPFFSGASSSTNTSVGVGVPIILALKKNSWEMEITTTFRYPETKKWLVQRNGVNLEDERNVIIDFGLTIIKKFKSKNNFVNSSWYGFGISFLNFNGNISGSYDLLSPTGLVKIDYNNMRMIGPHAKVSHSFNRKTDMVISLIYIDGAQVQNKPNIRYYLIGKLGVTYSLFNQQIERNKS